MSAMQLIPAATAAPMGTDARAAGYLTEEVRPWGKHSSSYFGRFDPPDTPAAQTKKGDRLWPTPLFAQSTTASGPAPSP